MPIIRCAADAHGRGRREAAGQQHERGRFGNRIRIPARLEIDVNDTGLVKVNHLRAAFIAQGNDRNAIVPACPAVGASASNTSTAA